MQRRLLEFQMREQIRRELVERIGELQPRRPIRQIVGEPADPVEQGSDDHVVGLQPVDRRRQVRRGAAYGREQHGVLVVVVSPEGLAVAQTVHPQLEQRATALQRLQVGRHLGRGCPVGDPVGELPNGGEVATEHLVHPAQLIGQGLFSRVRHDISVSRRRAAGQNDVSRLL